MRWATRSSSAGEEAHHPDDDPGPIPGRFRIDSQMPAGLVSQVFDSVARSGFRIPAARTAPASAAQSMRGNVQRDAIGLLLALADGRVKARRVDDLSVDGRCCRSWTSI